MKRKSRLIVALAVVIAVTIAGIFLFVANVDSLVKSAVEKYGSRATATDVTVVSVKIGLREGSGSITGLSIGNPKGFSTPSAFSLRELTIRLDTSTLTKDPVVIEQIKVSAPRVVYEINKAGKANINAIRNNLSAYGNTGKPARTGETNEGKRLLIRRLIIEEGEMEIHLALKPGKPLRARIGRMEMQNVGGKGGSTPGEIAVQALRPLVEGAIKAAARAGVKSYLGQEAEGLKERVKEEVQEGIGERGREAVERLFGK